MKVFKKQRLLDKAIDAFLDDIRGFHPYYKGTDGEAYFEANGRTFGVRYSVNFISGLASLVITKETLTDSYFSHQIKIKRSDYGTAVVSGAKYKFKPEYPSDKRILERHMERVGIY